MSKEQALAKLEKEKQKQEEAAPKRKPSKAVNRKRVAIPQSDSDIKKMLKQDLERIRTEEGEGELQLHSIGA